MFTEIGILKRLQNSKLEFYFFFQINNKKGNILHFSHGNDGIFQYLSIKDNGKYVEVFSVIQDV